MRKVLFSFFLVFLAFFIFTSKANAQLRLTNPSPVAASSGIDLSSSIVEDSLGRIHVFAATPGNDDLNNPENYRIFRSTYNTATGSFGTPAQVTTLTRVTEVKALSDSTGSLNLLAVKYVYGEPGGYDLFWSKNSGSGWSVPQRLTDFAGPDTQATITEIGNGNLAVVFARKFFYDVNGNIVSSKNESHYVSADLYQMSYVNGVWSTPTAIDSTPFIGEGYPTLVKGPGTKLYLAYANNETGSWSVLWRSYDTSTSTWSAPKILENGIMGGYLQQPAVINDVPGKYRLVYANKFLCPNENCPNAQSSYASEIRYRTYDSTTNIWSDAVSLTNRSSFYADNPSAIADRNGTYWLTFRYLPQTYYGGDNISANLDIYWMKSLPNTPVGTNVTVDLRAGSSITFDNVTVEGNTTMDTSSSNPGDTTGVFKVGDFYYDINTNASYTGGMNITLKYSDQNMTPEDEAALKVFHWLADSNQWEDATTSVDTVNNIIYARVTSLSWIMIGKYTANLTWLAPIVNIENNETYAFNDGSTLPIKFSLKNINNDPMYDSSVSVKVSGNGGEAAFVLGEGTDNIRYDGGSGQYIVNLHTKNYSWIVPGPTYEIKVSNSVSTDLGTTYFTTLDGGKAQGKNK